MLPSVVVSEHTLRSHSFIAGGADVCRKIATPSSSLLLTSKKVFFTVTAHTSFLAVMQPEIILLRVMLVVTALA